MIIHFIVEVSWVDIPNKYNCAILNNFNREFSDWFHTNKPDFRSSFVLRPWINSLGPWSVSSYDLIWGHGHAYAGATITVGQNHTDQLSVLSSFLTSYRQQLSSPRLSSDNFSHACSDCVAVIHRIGDTLRNHEKNQARSAINPLLQEAYLWVEMDCGNFLREREKWESCRQYVDESQRKLDGSFSEETKYERYHYPNVPNLATDDWQHQYYGRNDYSRLQRIKDLWDPLNSVNHHQSIKPSQFPEEEYDLTDILRSNHSEPEQVKCKSIYVMAAMQETIKIIQNFATTVLLVMLVAWLSRNIWRRLTA
jgi:hypothetical protein